MAQASDAKREGAQNPEPISRTADVSPVLVSQVMEASNRCSRCFKGFGVLAFSTLRQMDPAFEKAAAQSSLRFQLGHIILQVLGVGLYQLGARVAPNSCPRIGMLFPCAISIAVRSTALALGRWWRRMPILPVAAAMLVLDMALVTTWRPDVEVAGMWDWDPNSSTQSNAMMAHVLNETILESLSHFNNSSSIEYSDGPEHVHAHLQALQETLEEAQWGADQTVDVIINNAELLYGFRLVIVFYAFQLLLWYNVTFVLVLRHTLPAIVLGIAGAAAVYLTFLKDRDKDDSVQNSWTSAFVVELVLMIFTASLALSAKVHIERSQHSLLLALEQKTKEAIQEKVLRFQAEFVEEQTRAELNSYMWEGSIAEGSEVDSAIVPADRSPATKKRRAPASFTSAPPAMLSFLSGAAADSDKTKGDCLPNDALVWIEGAALPTKVHEALAGQSVLCYDNVARCLKYTKVTGVDVISGQTHWVKVSLVDGTALTMTADHPIKCHDRKAGTRGRSPCTSTRSIRAADLEPGVDAVPVLRLVPVTVDNVAEASPGENVSEERRIALKVRQPERYSVFVAAPGESGSASTMAVGSADAERPEHRRRQNELRVRHTFIDLQDDAFSSTYRCHSAPGRISMWSTLSEKDDEESAPSPCASSPRLHHHHRKRTSHTLPRSLSDSDLSSERTPESLGQSVDEVLVGSGDRSMMNPEAFYENVARASALIRSRLMGVKSIGSIGHASGNCRACLFENRHQHLGAEPCFKGSLCDRCHEPHEPFTRPKKKPAGKRKASSKAKPLTGLSRELPALP